MKFLSLDEDDAKFEYDNTIASFTKDGTIPAELQERMVQDQIEALKPDTKPKAQDLFVLRFLSS